LELLPISGFVLAGGKSSRMGVDKAELRFCGRPLVELAVEKLSSFCEDVAISGNRDDLARFAPVVMETRLDTGPGAGVEAGLRAAECEWCLFVPVDVPLLPLDMLRSWAAEILAAEGEGVRGSYLMANGQPQPSICLLRRDCVGSITRALDSGERRLRTLLTGIDAEFGVGSLRLLDAAAFAPNAVAEDLDRRFSNLNTPEELAKAEESGFRSA
jgi:molybdopterin-guanine dinucleotide biosynthesis protein A